MIEEAVAHGYVVALYIVALDDPQRLLARVQRRVREGGHSVPPDRILARYPRTLENLSKAVRIATVAYLYESREIEAGGHQLVAMCEREKVTGLVETMPLWVKKILGGPSENESSDGGASTTY